VRRLAPHNSHKRTHTLLVNLNSNPASRANGKAHPHSTGVAFERGSRDPPRHRVHARADAERDRRTASVSSRRAPSAIARRVGVARRTCLNTVHALYAWGCPARHVYAACWHVLLTYLPARTCLLTSHSTGVTSQWNTTLHPHDSHVSIGHLSPLRARCFALAWCHQRTECPPRRATQHHPSVV